MATIVPFPKPSYAESLEPNAPLLLVLDADRALADVTVDIARRNLTIHSAANAASVAEHLLDELETFAL